MTKFLCVRAPYLKPSERCIDAKIELKRSTNSGGSEENIVLMKKVGSE